MRARKSLASLLVLILLTAGCAHKTNNLPVSPWERVTTYNASYAALLNSTIKGTIALNGTVDSSGQPVLPTQLAAGILSYEQDAVLIDEQLTNIFDQSAKGGASDPQQVAVLLGTIQTAGQALIQEGDIGVKNPSTQQTVSADLQAIVGTAQVLLSLYQNAIANSGGH